MQGCLSRSDLCLSRPPKEGTDAISHRAHRSTKEEDEFQECLTTERHSLACTHVQFKPASSDSSAESKALSFENKVEAQRESLPVLIHIYNLGFVPKWLNAIAKVSVGGAFHIGVEVACREWSFGAAPRGSNRGASSGINWCRPHCNPDHVYSSSAHVGYTSLSRDEILNVITDMGQEYTADSYCLTTRNCLTFAEDLCHNLQVVDDGQALPEETTILSQRLGRVNRLAKVIRGLVSWKRDSSSSSAAESPASPPLEESDVYLGSRLEVTSGSHAGKQGTVVGWTIDGHSVGQTSKKSGTVALQLGCSSDNSPEGWWNFDVTKLCPATETFRPAPASPSTTVAGYPSVEETSTKKHQSPCEVPGGGDMKSKALPAPGNGLFRVLLANR